MSSVKIKQFKVGFDNFCYIIICLKTNNAAIVDPGYDASKSLKFIISNNLKLQYIINTHYHSDHSKSSQEIKNLISSKIVMSKYDSVEMKVKVDIIVGDGDQLKVGEVNLDFLLTPGHTQGSICIIVNNEALLTGDTLFIGDCGRTDLPGGDLTQMYKTLNKKIIPLPNHLIIYPGHDYGDKPFDTLGNQKKTNKTLRAKNLEEFSKIP